MPKYSTLPQKASQNPRQQPDFFLEGACVHLPPVLPSPLQQIKQQAGDVHVLRQRFEARVGAQPIHTALVIRVLSRDRCKEACYRGSHVVIGEAKELCALALDLVFPCATNTAWISCIEGAQSKATEAVIHDAAGYEIPCLQKRPLSSGVGSNSGQVRVDA